MNLAFYYHIPIKPDGNELKIPSYLGVFIDALAAQVTRLYLVMHQSTASFAEADYTLQGKNITWINLGPKTPAWHRAIFYRRILRQKLESLPPCDIMLVRSPSPLAPYFGNYLQRAKLVYMIVGDYSEGVQHMNSAGFRQQLIKQFLQINNYLFEKRIRQTDVVVNSTSLFNKYQPIAKSIHQIRTTTLSENDFYDRADTCQQREIQLVFTGRIDPQKGLFELVEVTAKLCQNGFPVVCNIVGWESDPQKPVEQALKKYAQEQKIAEKLIFHGRKTVGPELNAMYRMGDIYVIPSYHEGFPRTIWEAMANSLPVIATRVGAIPEYLKDQKHAILIQPKNTEDLYDAIKTMMTQVELRQALIEQGRLLASENTLEFQTQHLVKTLEHVAST